MAAFVITGCLMVKGMSKWGALELTTDSEVRSRIDKCGIKLPAEAHDIYHAQSGFVDSSVWMKFTVPKDQIWSVVANSIKKRDHEFQPVIPEHLLKEIDQHADQTYDLRWWMPESVKKPLSWSLHKTNDGGEYFEDWLIDIETGTFYITKWDT